MRYVQDAPLASIRSDLGIASRMQQSSSSSSSGTGSAEHSRRLAALESKIADLEHTLQGHTSELAILSSAASSSSIGEYIQNSTTAMVHQASTAAQGRTRCGWCFDGSTYRARRQVSAKSFRVLPSLAGLPGDMICERCLPSERTAALGRDLVHDDLSGDEQPVVVQQD